MDGTVLHSEDFQLQLHMEFVLELEWESRLATSADSGQV